MTLRATPPLQLRLAAVALAAIAATSFYNGLSKVLAAGPRSEVRTGKVVVVAPRAEPPPQRLVATAALPPSPRRPRRHRTPTPRPVLSAEQAATDASATASATLRGSAAEEPVAPSHPTPRVPVEGPAAPPADQAPA